MKMIRNGLFRKLSFAKMSSPLGFFPLQEVNWNIERADDAVTATSHFTALHNAEEEEEVSTYVLAAADEEYKEAATEYDSPTFNLFECSSKDIIIPFFQLFQGVDERTQILSRSRRITTKSVSYNKRRGGVCIWGKKKKTKCAFVVPFVSYLLNYI